jgi:glutamine synthetase
VFRDEECAALPPGRQALRTHLGREERRCMERLWRELGAMGFLTEAMYAEDGPGQFEINLAAGEPLATCDAAFHFRRAVKQTVAGEGLVATFMAKPVPDGGGSGFHLHQTATLEGGGPAFAAEGESASAECLQFAAGQVAYAVEAAALYLPTVNAYKRIKLRGPCPLSLCWAWDNRSCALRLIKDPGGELRIENRIPGADANPYLITAAAVATGLAGVQQELTPPEPVTESTYLGREGGEALPGSLGDALAALNGSSLLREWLGDELVDAFVGVKSREADRFASAITDWERDEYLAYL